VSPDGDFVYVANSISTDIYSFKEFKV